jgi:hypothetical protein
MGLEGEHNGWELQALGVGYCPADERLMTEVDSIKIS